MKKFIWKTILYLMPFAAVILPFFYVSARSMEIYDFDRIIKRQREMSRECLVGMGYNEQTSYYKLNNANFYGAETISLGTSRVMQIKRDYFKTSFYNCGGAVGGNYDEYLNFLTNMEESALPRYLILGLDSWVFNDAWNNSLAHSSFMPIRKSETDRIGIIKRIYDDYLGRKWSFRQILDGFPNIGFNGIIKGNGYQLDGSYYYTSTYLYPERQDDYQFKSTLKRVEEGNSRFEYGAEVDPETIRYLDELLKFCRERHIQVAAFLPPFAPPVLDKMEEHGSDYQYMTQIAPWVSDLFAQYGFEFYNYTDVRKLGCDDSYFVDGFHGGDIAYGLMLADMCERGSFLGDVIDDKVLGELLRDRESNLIFEPVSGQVFR